MTKYGESQGPSEPLVLREAILELPDGRDFKSATNRRAPKGFLDFCASYLPKIRQRSDYRKRRLEDSCPAEFDLHHPERIQASYPKALLNEILSVDRR